MIGSIFDNYMFPCIIAVSYHFSSKRDRSFDNEVKLTLTPNTRYFKITMYLGPVFWKNFVRKSSVFDPLYFFEKKNSYDIQV